MNTDPQINWRGVASIVCSALVVGSLGVGCKSPRDESVGMGAVDSMLDPAIDPKNSEDPAGILAALPWEVIREIRARASSVTPPERLPRYVERVHADTYREWYRIGYAKAFVTGLRHQRTNYFINPHVSSEYRSKMFGWYDGNLGGDLARLSGWISGPSSTNVQGSSNSK